MEEERDRESAAFLIHQVCKSTLENSDRMISMLPSASITTDAAGNRTAELHYASGAWGETRCTSGSTYTGQREDPGLGGLMFYRARYYDNTLGRFAQADTMIPGPGNPMAWDRYAGMANNPLRYTDPSGHSPACGNAYSDPECNNEGGLSNGAGPYWQPTQDSLILQAIEYLASTETGASLAEVLRNEKYKIRIEFHDGFSMQIGNHIYLSNTLINLHPIMLVEYLAEETFHFVNSYNQPEYSNSLQEEYDAKVITNQIGAELRESGAVTLDLWVIEPIALPPQRFITDGYDRNDKDSLIGFFSQTDILQYYLTMGLPYFPVPKPGERMPYDAK